MSKFSTVSTRVLATLILLGTARAQAETFARTLDAHPLSRATPVSCRDVLAHSEPFQVVDTFLVKDGPTNQTRAHSVERSPLIDPIVRRVLNDWVKGRDYTAEQAEMLWGRDKALDPRRTGYIHLENEGNAAILRIFDGSKKVLSGGTEWASASASDPRSPMEINTPGFVLPEHRTGNPFWEISLLNVERSVRSGVDVLLGHVGSRLDLHYNDNEFRVFGRTDTIAARHMMIYAQTRANRVEIFKRYGFQPVLTSDANGVSRPFEISKNCVWMYMKAEDFIKMHHRVHLFIAVKGSTPLDDKASHASFESEQAKVREHLERVEKNKLNIRTQHEALQEFQKVFEIYVEARQMPGQTAERRNKIIDFFEAYLRLISSLPESMRDPKSYINIRNLTRECMSQSTPLTGFYYLAKSMDSLDRPQSGVSDDDEKKFFEKRADSKFRLPLPTNPLAFLSWSPLNIFH